jgi:urease accessory protein
MRLGAGLLLALLALPATAHGTLPGINQFYNGVLHPLLAPAHLLSLLALALMAGQQGLRPRPWEHIGLGLGMALGAMAAAAAGDPDTDRWLWCATLWVGAGVALARPQPRLLRALVGLVVGVCIGLGSADVALRGSPRIAALLGSCMGALILIAYAALAVEQLLKRVTGLVPRIGLRVLASWISACALLMLALSLKQAA